MSTTPYVKIEVTRQYDILPARVFDAWLDEKEAGKWLFATPSGEMVRVEMDPRVGGAFTIVERRDGEDVTHTGEYIEIDRPRRLVFSFSVKKYSDEASRVVIDIVPLAKGCKLILTQEVQPQWENYAERIRSGWAGILDGLAGALT